VSYIAEFAWQDAYPDAGTTLRGEKGTAFEGGWRVPGLMWWPNLDVIEFGFQDTT
jgi:arylsulfatase A-like enzyme